MKVTIEHHGITASGRTMKEAKQEAVNRLAAALRAPFTPKLITVADYEAKLLVYRTGIESFSYTIMTPTTGRINESSCYSSFEDAEKSGRNHAAQWVNSEEKAEDHGLQWLTDSYQRLDHIQYVAWQNEYARLKEEHRDWCDMTIRANINEAEETKRLRQHFNIV